MCVRSRELCHRFTRAKLLPKSQTPLWVVVGLLRTGQAVRRFILTAELVLYSKCGVDSRMPRRPIFCDDPLSEVGGGKRKAFAKAATTNMLPISLNTDSPSSPCRLDKVVVLDWIARCRRCHSVKHVPLVLVNAKRKHSYGGCYGGMAMKSLCIVVFTTRSAPF